MDPAEWLPTPPARFGGVGQRALALLLDTAVMGLYWGVVANVPLAGVQDGRIQLALLVAGPILYFPLAWGRFGTTMGMGLLGLRIVLGSDGRRIGYRVAGIRFAVFLPSVVATFALVGLLLSLPPILDHRRRAIHDRVAGTVVIRLPYKGTTFWFPF